MSTPPGLRSLKKTETRQMISNVATQLFVERGFENVSVDEIARVAGVSRKTVFNYFPRKEDLVFDREEELRALVATALGARGNRAPVGVFQDLMRALAENQHPLFRMSEQPVQFWRTVKESPGLTTWARALQVVLANDLAEMFCDAVERPRDDPEARLAAAMLIDTLVVAYGAALRAFREGHAVDALFRRLVERGFAGVNVALAGTPYVDA